MRIISSHFQISTTQLGWYCGTQACMPSFPINATKTHKLRLTRTTDLSCLVCFCPAAADLALTWFRPLTYGLPASCLLQRTAARGRGRVPFAAVDRTCCEPRLSAEVWMWACDQRVAGTLCCNPPRFESGETKRFANHVHASVLQQSTYFWR